MKLAIFLLLLILLVGGLTVFHSPTVSAAEGEQRDAPKIHLQYAVFDPLQGEPILPAPEPLDGFGSERAGVEDGLYIVQFSGPVEEGWKAAVEATGSRLFGYIPDYAYIARIPAEVVEQVKALSPIRWVGEYHPAYRVESSLVTEIQEVDQTDTPVQALILSVVTPPDADFEALALWLVELGGEIQETAWKDASSQGSNEFGGYLRVLLPQDKVEILSSHPDVVWIELYFQPEPLNDKAAGTILKAETVRQNLGLFGEDQIVAVADTGLDVGTTGPAMSDDFEGRIVAGQGICALFGGREGWNDLDGHGTHVSGSVLGNGVLSGSQPGSNQYGSSYAGVAPKAKIVFQSVDDGGGSGLECVPSNLKDYLIKPAFDQGARVHSNSWGGQSGDSSNPYGGYNTFAQAADQAAWAYKNMLVVFAAGNSSTDGNSDGVVDLDGLLSPGTAKNVLTVAASENDRPERTLTWGNFSGFPVNPLNSDRVANNVNGMAGFSSRGPADDGRIKPDITAPGTYIISARSHDPSAGTGWGTVNDHYIYMGGTSMATPLTSGAAALVREWLTRIRNFVEPSAALIKAVLINGAVDMSPGQYGTGGSQEIPAQRPNPVNGWGRVDLQFSLMPPGSQQVWVRDESSGLSTGGTKTYTLNLGSALGSPASNILPVQANIQTPPEQVENAEQPVTGGGFYTPLPMVPEAHASASSAQLVLNPGFESGGESWYTNNAEYVLVSQAQAHSGTQSAVLYGGSGDWVTIYQRVNIPVDASGVTVDFYGYGSTLGGGDGVYAVLRTSSGQLVNYQLADPGNSAWSQFSWTLDYDTLDQIKGQEVRVSFEAIIESESAKVYIDDTELNVTTPGAATGGTMRVTLVWTDYPGSPSASKALVNDLDLEVVAPDGTHYRGNAGVYASGSCLRNGMWDSCNNVEGILLPQAMTGTYSVIIHGVNVPNGPQPFALVVSGDCVYSGCAAHQLYLPSIIWNK